MGKYRLAQRIPGRLRVLAPNVVNNLRHSPDQAVNCAALELGATARKNYLPLAEGVIEAETARLRATA